MGVRLLGRAMLGQLVVAAINCDFVRTVKPYDLARYRVLLCFFVTPNRLASYENKKRICIYSPRTEFWRDLLYNSNKLVRAYRGEIDPVDVDRILTRGID